MSDLVAEAPEGTGLGGTRALDSCVNVFNDVTAEDFDPMSFAIDGVVAGLDLLAFAANPLKEFIMAGFGWIIENVSFINEPFNQLMGNPGEIQALTETWANISGELDAAAQAMAGAIGEVDDWEGDAADAYRRVGDSFAQVLSGASGAANSVANGISISGVVVATVRGLVLELICDFAARGVMYLIAAAASAAFTFGGSLIAAAGTVIMDAGTTIAKCMYKIGSALSSLADLFRSMTKCKGAFKMLANGADTAASAMRTGARKVDFGSLRQGMNLKFAGIKPSSFDLGDISGRYKNMADGVDWSPTNPMDSNRFGDAVQAADVGGGYPATGIKAALGESDNQDDAFDRAAED